MSGVSDPNTVDVVAQEADGGIVLVMVEDRPWGTDPDQAKQLQDKCNTYAGYVLDGSLVRDYPEAEGVPTRIRLDCVEEPSGHFAHITSHTVEQLAKHDIAFQVNARG